MVGGEGVRRLGDVPARLGLTLPQALALVESSLRPGPYSKQEVCEELGITLEQLDSTWLSERSRNGPLLLNMFLFISFFILFYSALAMGLHVCISCALIAD